MLTKIIKGLIMFQVKSQENVTTEVCMCHNHFIQPDMVIAAKNLPLAREIF